jgi:hypothetical protein
MFATTLGLLIVALLLAATVSGLVGTAPLPSEPVFSPNRDQAWVNLTASGAHFCARYPR